jgi:hypothetical protein
VLFIEGRHSASTARERCGSDADYCMDPSAVVSGERARARADIGGWMLGAGLAMAGGGLLWRWLALSPPPAAGERAQARSMSWDTAISRSAAELKVQGCF